MNVYEKLQKARVALQNKGLNKSGNNKFVGYTYFELADFLPTINQLCLELKLATQISFTSEIATLKIVNAEKPEEIIEFTSPMAEAKLKGCHEIQNLGAIESYQRRYLFVTAFEIVENDVIDASTGEGNKQQGKAANLSDAQIKRLYGIANKAGYAPAKVVEHIIKKFGCKPEQMTKAQYDELCTGYEKLGATNGN